MQRIDIRNVLFEHAPWRSMRPVQGACSTLAARDIYMGDELLSGSYCID